MPNAKTDCCLCGLPYERIGNNPAPLATNGRCCDACNEIVIEARIWPAQIDAEIERVADALLRVCDDLPLGDTHKMAVAAICASRGPGLLAQKREALRAIRGESIN